MFKSNHRRQYLVDRISSSLASTAAMAEETSLNQPAAGAGRPDSKGWSQKLLAVVLMLGVLAVPLAILVVLLNR